MLSEPLVGTKDAAGRKSSRVQTALNIMNNYVGMTLLSFPFCAREAGWASAAILLVLSAFCAYTGWLVVQAYARIVADGHAAPSYAQLGQVCLGPAGKWLVLVSSTFETLVSIPGMFIGIWANAALLFPSITPSLVIAGCIAVSLPANGLSDFTMLSSLSLLGIISIGLVCLAVGYDVLASSDQLAPPRELVDLDGFPMASSITMAGLTGHVALFPIYEEMREQTYFKQTLFASFALIFLIYGSVQVGGYCVYGSTLDILVTTNMASGERGPIGTVLFTLVLSAITFKLFCSVAGTVLVLVDIFENVYHEQSGARFDNATAMCWRLAMWLTSIVVAGLAFSSLQYVTALIGINSVLISVLLPIFFYVKLHWQSMGRLRKLWFGSLSLLSILMVVAIACVDIQEFTRSLGLGA